MYFLEVTSMLQRSLFFTEIQTKELNSTKISDFSRVSSLVSCTHLCGLEESCDLLIYDQTDETCQLHKTTKEHDDGTRKKIYIERKPPYCVAGFYSSTGLAPCTICEAGSYQATPGSKSCTPCEVGSYQASAGSLSCTVCRAGTSTLTRGSTAPTDCNALCVAGSYSSTGMDPCSLCEVGSYQATVGSTSCTACGALTSTLTKGSTAPTDCNVHVDCGEDSVPKKSGVYNIKPEGAAEPFQVYCDQDTDGGRWTHTNNSQGKIDPIYQLIKHLPDEGNLKINAITSQGPYELRIDLADFEGDTRYAHYSTFSVGDVTTDYQLTVRGYSGNAGDCLVRKNGMKFSTYDKDNDLAEKVECAALHHGAWWYRWCQQCNLNGIYKRGIYSSYRDGVTWVPWKGFQYSLKTTSMEIRRAV
ncbi:hypothetical protein ScPMuIL_011059 [Solemya velum]